MTPHVLTNLHSDTDWLVQWQHADREPVFFSIHPREWQFISAAWLQEPVVFEYWGGSSPSEVRRIVPHRVFRVTGFDGLYFNGWCEKRQAERTFRVDRALLATDEQTKPWPGPTSTGS